jgi:hypothetical protein
MSSPAYLPNVLFFVAACVALVSASTWKDPERNLKTLIEAGESETDEARCVFHTK